MTEEASNSFLKTLEEPLDHILFILTTTRESYILRTIVSRCQKIQFSGEKFEADEAVGKLTEKFLNIEKTDISDLLILSDELSADPGLEEKLNNVLYDYRERTSVESAKKFLAMREILNAVRALEKRGNKRLALDNMFLRLKEAAAS